MLILILMYAIGATTCGIFGYYLGGDRGREWLGFWLGFLFGPIGILTAAVMQPTPFAAASHRQAVDAAMHQKHQYRQVTQHSPQPSQPVQATSGAQASSKSPHQYDSKAQGVGAAEPGALSTVMKDIQAAKDSRRRS